MVTDLDGCRIDSRSRVDGSTWLEISGELDSVNADPLSRILCEAALAGDATLDLGGVRFVDSSGLRALVRAALSARDAGHSLRLVNLTPRTSKLIEVARLGDVLIVDDAAE